MGNLKLIIIGMILMVSADLNAKNLQNYFEEPKVVGQARLSMFFFDIYGAALIAPNGEFAEEKPFALELTYLREFEGKEIASRSGDERRKLGVKDEVKLAKWYQEMQDIFPDVKEGQTITGVVDNDKVSHFYFNNKLVGKVHDPEFSKWFFNIWLHEKTSEPKVRERLLGLKR